MNRSQLKELAEIRVAESAVLLRNRKYSGAYYLAGYAVECALKACIAKQIRRYEFPDRKLVQDSYTLNLENLVKLARLGNHLINRQAHDQAFTINWAITKDWREESRYTKTDQRRAADLYVAITQQNHGILEWLQQHW
jgi:hypothetical protein